MPAEARIAPIWKKQKLFVAIFIVAFGCYFFFDGAVGYPRSNTRWTAHQQHPNDWPEFAKSQGWDTKVPEHPFTAAQIRGQFVYGTICVLLGTIIFIYWTTQLRRTLRMDEEAVYTPAGTRVPFTAITGIGKKKWESKGIAKVRYELEGRKGEFIVDDYKFDTEPSRQILKEIEERLLARSK